MLLRLSFCVFLPERLGMDSTFTVKVTLICTSIVRWTLHGVMKDLSCGDVAISYTLHQYICIGADGLRNTSGSCSKRLCMQELLRNIIHTRADELMLGNARTW